MDGGLMVHNLHARCFGGWVQLGPDVRIACVMPLDSDGIQTNGCIVVGSNNVASKWPAKPTGNGRERAAVKNVRKPTIMGCQSCRD